MSRRLVLCGDIGGTKTLLAVGALDGDRFDVVFERRYADRDFADFADLVRDLPRRGADERRARVPRHRGSDRRAGAWPSRTSPGRSTPTRSRPILGAPVALANDFVAAAHGIDLLRPEDVATLQAGEPEPRAPQLVIGAGTGLGVAYRVWQGDRYAVIGGEGGHAGFAPADERQADLWRALHARLGRVRVEHVVSGPGLVRIYDFLRQGRGEARSPEEIASGADPVARAAARPLPRMLRRGGGRPSARDPRPRRRLPRRRDRAADPAAARERSVPGCLRREGHAREPYGALPGQSRGERAARPARRGEARGRPLTPVKLRQHAARRLAVNNENAQPPKRGLPDEIQRSRPSASRRTAACAAAQTPAAARCSRPSNPKCARS